VQGHSRRSVLAQTPVVSTTGGVGGRASPTPASSRGPSQGSGPGRSTSVGGPGSRAPAVDCMAVIRPGGRRESTLRTYSQRLAPYYRWCSRRKVSPTRASTIQVGEFLTEKFDEGLQSATVRNYKSAILSVHRGFSDGSTLNDGDHLSKLLDGMFNERPPPRTVVPTWELEVVLNYLKGPPFEPLRRATLKHLTLKTVFLVTLASGRRCSEVHALSARKTVFGRTGVTLFYRPDFVAKNESATFQHSSIFLPKMSMSSSIKEDDLWCPVRALIRYLDQTQSYRQNDQLFLTHAEPHGPASKSTLARWLVSVISDSGAVQQDSAVTAHSTRAVAASWAFQRGMTLDEICSAISWKAPTTFTNAYYRDVGGLRPRGFFTKSVLSTSVTRK